MLGWGESDSQSYYIIRLRVQHSSVQGNKAYKENRQEWPIQEKIQQKLRKIHVADILDKDFKTTVIKMPENKERCDESQEYSI